MLILPKPIEFQWDEGNRTKNYLKHKVNVTEAEECFANKPVIIVDDSPHSATEKRYLLWGQTINCRKLTVIFTLRSGLVRIISARDMNKKERRFYEQKNITNS